MRLQIGTDELAKRLYDTWRQEMDRIDPVTMEEVWQSIDRGSVTTSTVRPRPTWEHLDSVQQGVWRAVAQEAGRALADGMEAR